MITDVSDRSIASLLSPKGRTAVVTGGAKGIGLAIARRLAEAGASVAIGDIDAAEARRAATALQKDHAVPVLGEQLDVRDSRSVAVFADAVMATRSMR